MNRKISNESKERIIQGAKNANKNRNEKLRNKYDLNPTFCNNCGSKFPYEKRGSKFCNQSCAASFNNSKFIKRPKQNQIIKYCLNCNKSNILGIYCSNECQHEYQLNEKIKKWINGEEIGLCSIKNYLLKQTDNKCMLCGWGGLNKFTQRIPLELHHVDGNSNNNRPENLQILCPNCHSLTGNYKGANKKSERTYRKKYYAPTQNRTEI